MAEDKNEKKIYANLLLFFHEIMFQITIMQSDATVVSIVAIFFNSCSYYNSYTQSKNIKLTVQ